MRLQFLRRPALLLAFAASAAAPAQGIPPHVPGTICYTPQGWCGAMYPGPPGTRCACLAGGVWLQGVLI